MRCSAPPTARGPTWPRPSTSGWPWAPSRTSSWPRPSSRSSRHGRVPGARPARHARQAQAGRRGAGLGDYVASALVHVGDGPRRAPRGTAGGCPRGAGARPPPAAPARPRHPLAHRPGRPRAHPRPSRAGRGRRRPHGLDRDRTGARAPPGPRLPRRGGAGAARARGGDVQPGRRLGDEPDRRRSCGCFRTSPPTSRSPRSASDCSSRRNTVKTEAASIYRKLGASSRSEAIERAVKVGLLESSIYPPRPNRHLKA